MGYAVRVHTLDQSAEVEVISELWERHATVEAATRAANIQANLIAAACKNQGLIIFHEVFEVEPAKVIPFQKTISEI